MKIKNIILGALMTVIAAPTMAQVQQDAIMDQVSAIIKSGAPDAAKQVQTIAKENKKNVNALVSIGKAYLAAKDYANAKKYAQQATDLVNKTKEQNATPFILMGNIAVGEDDGGVAAEQFQQAIYFDPKNPDGYRRYAQIMSKTDPNGAVQTLEDLRTQRPDYPVDLIAAEIYQDANNMEKAIKYYSKVSLDQMKDYQLSQYATSCFLTKKYDESLKVAQFGQQKFPRNASLNRLAMFNLTEKGEFEGAIAAGDKLFNASDSAKISSYDCGYYARACEGAKKYDLAVEAYKKFMSVDGVKDEEKLSANKSISDCYKKMSDYAKAEEYLNIFIKGHSTTSFGLEETVAELWSAQVPDDALSADKRMEAYKKADAIYGALVEKYPEQGAYVANCRAKLPFGLALSDMEKLKLAGPHYAKLAEILYAKSDRSAGETKLLNNAYNASIAYYVHVMNDMESAKAVAAKALEVDPENANAKAVMGN